MFVFLNGQFFPQEDAKISPFDNGFLFGDGIYETMRTYAGKLWNFEGHFARFERSAEMMSLKIPYSKEEFEDLINQLISKNGFEEQRIKMILSRGEAGNDYSLSENPTIFIYSSELEEQPKEFYEKGVSAIIVPITRTLPEIKSLSLIATVRSRQEAAKKNAFEAFLLDKDGYVTEGSITNVYFVSNGDVFSPEIDMLPGTTREILVRLMAEKGISVVFKKCEKEAFYEADEIFISNAVKGVVPVVKIDDFVVGEGVPGSLTKQIMQIWSEKVESFKLANEKN